MEYREQFRPGGFVVFQLVAFGLLTVSETVWAVNSLADSNTVGTLYRAALAVVFALLFCVAVRNWRKYGKSRDVEGQ
jgi:predicted acyltransferase